MKSSLQKANSKARHAAYTTRSPKKGAVPKEHDPLVVTLKKRSITTT